MSKLFQTLMAAVLVTGLSACTEPDTVDALSTDGHADTTGSELDMALTKDPGMSYQPDLLSVAAIGRIETAPDIAIITGTIEIEDDNHNLVYARMADIINDVQAIADTAETEMSYTQIAAQDIWDEDCIKRNQDAANRNRERISVQQGNKAVNRQITELESSIDRLEDQHDAKMAAHRSRLTKLERNRDIPEFRRDIFNLEEAMEQAKTQYERSRAQYEDRLKSTRDRIQTLEARLPTEICQVTHVTGRLSFTARINPAKKAPDFINDFTQAGVTEVSLFAYDFSDYDALYQKAAERAVANARDKATLIAERSGTRLKKVKSFSVSQPTRFGRFGPQNLAVVSQPRYANFISIPPEFETVTETIVIQPQSVEYVQAPPTFETVTEPVIVQEATTELVTIPATYETVTETIVVQPQYEYNGQTVPAVTKNIQRRVVKTPARTVEKVVPAVTKMETRRVIKTPASTTERVIPAVTKQITRRVLKTPSQTITQGRNLPNGNSLPGQVQDQRQSNALRSSVLSGPQTIEVSAVLVFDYATALDVTL